MERISTKKGELKMICNLPPNKKDCAGCPEWDGFNCLRGFFKYCEVKI